MIICAASLPLHDEVAGEAEKAGLSDSSEQNIFMCNAPCTLVNVSAEELDLCV